MTVAAPAFPPPTMPAAAPHGQRHSSPAAGRTAEHRRSVAADAAAEQFQCALARTPSARGSSPVRRPGAGAEESAPAVVPPPPLRPTAPADDGEGRAPAAAAGGQPPPAARTGAEALVVVFTPTSDTGAAVPLAAQSDRLDAGLSPSPSSLLALPGDQWRAAQVVIERQGGGLSVWVDLEGGHPDARALAELQDRLRRRGLAAVVRSDPADGA